jgi:hypothetical protein
VELHDVRDARERLAQLAGEGKCQDDHRDGGDSATTILRLLPRGGVNSAVGFSDGSAIVVGSGRASGSVPASAAARVEASGRLRGSRASSESTS